MFRYLQSAACLLGFEISQRRRQLLQRSATTLADGARLHKRNRIAENDKDGTCRRLELAARAFPARVTDDVGKSPFRRIDNATLRKKVWKR